jgi:Trk-type K+ transport system membrane component
MTHFGPTLRILGLLLMLFSLTMLPPIGISVIFDDGQIPLFGAAAGLIFGAGFISWLPARRQKRDLRIRDGFVITVLFWLVLGSAGSVPLALSEQLNLSMTDALFESISGLTTTGATVIVGLDHLPKSVLFYRQQLQWLGGMGIVVLAVAILPMLGIGGMQLYRAETPGPVKDAKLSPRIAETAKALWLIYLSLTAACALAYWISGMAIFDAICHAFSTIAIGGFSPYDASIGHFNSVSIETVAIVFMVISGMNFSLHFIAWHNNSLKHYLHDPEWKTYLLFLFGLSLLISLALVENGTYPVNEAFRKGILAKKLGARKVMTLINNAAYVDLVQGGLVDIAVSPEQATIGSLLQLVRRGSIQAAHSLRRGAAEAIEAVAHGDERSSRVVGKKIGDIALPGGATIGAIVRNDEVLIAHDHIEIEHQDHVIMFLTDKRKITDIERLFSVAPTFL